jgi:threonine dehydrogenase-like Zn-dependent dehydrogenase
MMPAKVNSRSTAVRRGIGGSRVATFPTMIFQERQSLMKAVAVYPGKPHSIHLRDIEPPVLESIPGGRGVLVKSLEIGVDATDREINEALYGNAPPGFDYLVLGHESFGVVEAVGPNVKDLKPGDYVSCTVRRPGGSIYDKIGRNDITSEETYYERGINLKHGYLTERWVDDCEYMVKVPGQLKHLGVLSEPASVCAKAIEQAYLAQQRLQVWQPEVAYVMGSGQIGLLSTMILRLKGLEVYTVARSKKAGNKKAEIAEAYGATYVSTAETPLEELVKKTGKPQLIVEATGSSQLAFGAMEYLSHNGALVWTSITGGKSTTTVPSDKINLEWVLGNKLLVGSVNGNRKHFESGIQALAHGELAFPGVTEKLLTTRVDGLENYAELIRRLVEDKEAIKVYMRVSQG